MNFTWEALGGGMSGKVKLSKRKRLLFNSFQFASWKGSRKRDGAKGNERGKRAGRKVGARVGVSESAGAD